jgi:hypothetical protein
MRFKAFLAGTGNPRASATPHANKEYSDGRGLVSLDGQYERRGARAAAGRAGFDEDFSDMARAALEERYARGEIKREKYLQKKRDIVD